MRRSLRTIIAVKCWLLLAAVIIWPSDAMAYAWMIADGYTKCSTCHTDPSGGETLNHMGRVQSETNLSWKWGDDKVTSDSQLLYALSEPDALRVGGSLRMMSIYKMAKDGADSDLSVFPMQADVYSTASVGRLRAGLNLGYASVDIGSPHSLKAQIIEKEEGTNVVSRWHWVGLELSRRWLLRAGRLNLPFGLRVPEHVFYARDATLTDRESDQQHGLAMAYSGGRWRGEGMFVLGNYQIKPDDYRERGFVGFAEYALGAKTAVGLSTLTLQSAKSLMTRSQERTIRHAHGVMARHVLFDPFVLMAEMDVLKTTGSKLGYTGFVQGDYELIRGLHVGATAELLNRGKPEGAEEGTQGAGKATYAVWGTVQWFFYTHLDFRLDAVVRQNAATVIQSQLHFYF